MAGIGTGNGTTFKLGTTTPVTIGEITNISGFGSEINMIDVTTLVNDGNRKYISGLRDNEDIEITGNFDFTDAGQTELKNEHDSGTVQDFILEMKEVGAKLTGKCIVKKYSVEGFEVEGVITFKVTLQISGKPVLAALA